MRRLRVDFVEDSGTGCWMWLLTQSAAGYGYVFRDGFAGLAHRYYYEQLVGPIPAGLTLDHLCRRPPCVNPGHLEPVTNAVNVRRGNTAKLSQELVDDLRKEWAGTPGALNPWARRHAARHGVDVRTIERAVRGDRWAEAA